MIPSAYIHVPFCSTLCTYCAFAKTTALSLIDPWLDELEKEISLALKQAREADPDFSLQTIYIGGGTPSVLSADQLERLCRLLKPVFSCDGEWTVELNPESADRKKLEILKKYGVNRLSIGLQSFNDHRLQALGRHHDAYQGRRVIEMARDLGFDNISADLMYGFADQSMEELEADLDQFLSLDLDHLSIYSLIREPDTILTATVKEEMDEDLNALMYERIETVLEQNGFDHYEVSSYARSGKQGRHNSLIWQDGRYYGFGYGAIGRDEKGLYHHAGTLMDYIRHQSPIVYEEDENPWFDAIMTALRTRQGLDIRKWNERYGFDFESRYASVLDKYEEFLIHKGDFLSVNPKGMEMLDSILVDFLQVD